MKVEHIGIAVTDLDSSIKKFRQLCPGFDIRIEESKDGSMTIAFLDFENIKIELMEPKKEDTAVGKFIEKHGEGIHHLAVEVQNIVESIDNARNSNIRVINEIPQEGSEGFLVSFIHPKDFNGILLEFCQKQG